MCQFRTDQDLNASFERVRNKELELMRDSADMHEMFACEQYQPEQWLFIAVLQRAFWDFLHPQHLDVGPDRHAEAVEWLTSDSEAFMSFRWYCLMLADDPEGYRARLLARIGLLH